MLGSLAAVAMAGQGAGKEVSRRELALGMESAGRCMVRVSTPSRLHFGLIPIPCRGLGRYAGVGLALSSPTVVVEAAIAAQHRVVGSQRDRVERVLREVVRSVEGAHSQGVALRVVAAPPAHQGLGSGTQLSLATAVAVYRLLGVPFDLWNVARKLGRGRRSAIGVAVFEGGGFLIDCGRTASACGPEQLRRLRWPPDWRFVAVRLTPVAEISGAVEEAVFSDPDSLVMDRQVPEEMARLLLDEIPAAVADRDFTWFVGVLGTYGRLAGRCFERFQGGFFAHPMAERIARFTERQWGLPALQSSWGPTVAIPTPSAEEADRVRHRLEVEFQAELDELFVSEVASHGALVEKRQTTWS